MTTGARQPGIFGPEPRMEIAGQAWCHFDWWFALVAVADCEGDLEALRERLEQQPRGSLTGRVDVEAKLSHLGDLVHRLSGAGLDAASVAGTGPADRAPETGP